LRRRSDRAAIWEDIEPYLGTTVAQRATITSELSRLAAEQAAAHPERRRIFDYQEPRSARSLELWKRLMTRGRTAK